MIRPAPIFGTLMLVIICALFWIGGSEVSRLEDEMAVLQTTLEVEESLSAAYMEQVSHLRSEVESLTVALEESEAEVRAVHKDNENLKAQLQAAKKRAEVTPSRATSDGWSSAKASWYGSECFGNLTANGTPYNASAWGVAHKSLPFGTKIQFEYNGTVVTVPVFDRGPFIPGREFDLSAAVAAKLGFSGVQTIKYRILR